MARTDLWKYCSAEQCREMMLSFRLVGAGDWPPEKIMGCLYALSNYAEKHYQRVNIPKRSGGFRTLLVPDPLLKNVQRNLLHHVLDGFTVSDSAAAYRKGASVAANAGKHQGRKIVMKMDIEDFWEHHLSHGAASRISGSLFSTGSGCHAGLPLLLP